MSANPESTDRDKNRDLITGEPEAHPISTGVGAVGAGLAGTVAGSVIGGPPGAVVGAVVGAFAGGLAGHHVAVNPDEEDAHWRKTHQSEPYYDREYTYEDYEPGYRVGYSGYGVHANKGGFDDIEPDLRAEYERSRGQSKLDWEKARPASRAAWERVAAIQPGEQTGGDEAQPR